MKSRNIISKPFPWLPFALGLLVFGAAAAGSWNWYQKRYPSWYEEVRLSDGRVITIHQKRQYFENYGTNQSWVSIDLPELGGKQVWHSYLMPMRVDVVGNRVFVFGAPRGDLQFSIYGHPKHYLVAFIWNGNSFERIPFLSIPDGIRGQENVYPCVPNPTAALVKLDVKEREWCTPSGDKQQFGKEISLQEYQALAIRYSRRSGGVPMTE